MKVKLKFNPIHYDTSMSVSCQSLRFNRFRLTHSLQLQTENPETLFGLVHPAEYIPGQGLDGHEEAQVELKLDHTHGFSTALNYQISDYAYGFLKAKMVNVGALEYATSPLSYWRYSNWSHRIFSIGYRYKHFQLEYTLYSEFAEPKYQVLVGVDLPWSYFKDMLSVRYTQSTAKIQPLEAKPVKQSDLKATNVVETTEIESRTSTSKVEEPQTKSYTTSMSENTETGALLECFDNNVKEIVSGETIQQVKNSNPEFESMDEHQPILVLNSVEQALDSKLSKDLEVNPVNVEIEESEGSRAEATCGQKTYSQEGEVEDQGFVQSEATAAAPQSLASTIHLSRPIIGEALTSGVLFLSCTGWVIGHIWRRLNKK